MVDALFNIKLTSKRSKIVNPSQILKVLSPRLIIMHNVVARKRFETCQMNHFVHVSIYSVHRFLRVVQAKS